MFGVIVGDSDIPEEGELHVPLVSDGGVSEEGVGSWQWVVSLREVQSRDPELQVAPHVVGE